MEASPVTEFAPTPAGSEAVAGVTTTVRTIAECANTGNPAAVVALMTDNFIRDGLGADSRADAESRLSGLERMTIRLLQTPETYADGSASMTACASARATIISAFSDLRSLPFSSPSTSFSSANGKFSLPFGAGLASERAVGFFVVVIEIRRAIHFENDAAGFL